jgi:Xaa-Pro aminopeptidase
MRYATISSDLFIRNRQRLVKEMKPNSVAIVFASDLMPRGADSFHIFRQNPDLFWLTGVDQEETILLLYPDAPNPDWKEILFVRETNEHIAAWEGEKLSKPQATQMSGVKNVIWAQDFEKLIGPIVNQAENIYLHINEHDRFVSPVQYTDLRKANEIREMFPLHKYERLAPILHRLRAIKQKEEIELIKQAVAITKKGFERVMRFVKPGVMEYEIEAELTHEFLRNRSRGHAYEPIVASGASACVLHYVANDKPCQEGDLLLMDFGAEYANYASDLTRCIPVSGRFSPRQKEVYNAVLRVMRFAMGMLKPGTKLPEYTEAVGKEMEKELVGLGLITTNDIKNQDPKWPAYKKYFMHGTSHFLGIDVHDVGNRYLPIEEGMVFTCEPGIYIREEGIGVRIENNLVITSGKPIDLMEGFPIEVEEIEEAMSPSLRKGRQ